MKTFVTLLTFVCIGLVLMLAGNADAQEYEGTILPVTERAFAPGDSVEIQAKIEELNAAGLPSGITPSGITFRFSAVPVGIATFDPPSDSTDGGGIARTDMTISPNAVQILARIDRKNFTVTARSLRPTVALSTVYKIGIEPTKIVVLPPNSPGLSDTNIDLDGDGIDNDVEASSPDRFLQVNETFYQRIWIKDVEDLSAWQMDIKFNPAILRALTVTQGDFLIEGGLAPFFTSMIGDGKITAGQARIGRQNTPQQPLVNSPIGVTGTGELLTIEFQVLEFAEESLGLHNVQLSNSHGNRISYFSVINPVVVTEQFPREDVNRDGQVNILDLVMVAGSVGANIGTANPINPRADVNEDGIINVLDLVAVYQHRSWGGSVTPTTARGVNEHVGAAPAASVGNITPETLQGWIDLAHMENDGSLIFKHGIANLEHLLHAKVPTETKLLRSYPNPFNPETWIPYQLAKSAEVTLTIYSVYGTPIRTLALGHQSAGLYQNRSRAAYWDGRNELGTQVTSGLYFYTFTADDFSATGKMVVAK